MSVFVQIRLLIRTIIIVLALSSTNYFYGQTTYTTIADGDYNSIAVWSTNGGVSGCGCQPGYIENDEFVEIMHDLYIDIGDGDLEIDGGELIITGILTIREGNLKVKGFGNLIVQEGELTLLPESHNLIIEEGNFMIQNALINVSGDLDIKESGEYRGCGEINIGQYFNIEGDVSFAGVKITVGQSLLFKKGMQNFIDSTLSVDDQIQVDSSVNLYLENTYNCVGNNNDLSAYEDCNAVNNFSVTCSPYTLDFDGVNDYVDFNDKYDVSNEFSIEIWVKRASTSSGYKSIISKKGSSKGYELGFNNNKLRFKWNNYSLSTSQSISNDRWYHIAVTFNSSLVKLYVDGIELASTNSNGAPQGNSSKLQVGRKSGSNSNYYHGWLDELRIWNVTLSEDQIRKMMNQEIEQNSSNVRGSIIPRDIPGLLWSNLVGYYPMQYPNHISGNKLKGHSNTVSHEGELKNITTWQKDTTPLPYVSVRDGDWTNRTFGVTPWKYAASVWDYPNSVGLDGTPIDWNIVQINHNISSGDKDITLLGLLSEEEELTIVHPSGNQDETNYGHSLRLSWYLRLDGIIDLVGESQLLQDNDSWLDENSAGYLERDQQGILNSFAYNYWAAPVSKIGAGSNNTPHTVAEILSDGTDTDNTQGISFGGNTAYFHADGALSSPIKIASAWIWKFVNNISDYAEWQFVGSSGTLNVTEGYTMKGVYGAGTLNLNSSNQNYVFAGKPNNVPNDATNFEMIHTTFSTAYNISLTGNPFPSALDANAFINDNVNSIDGALYFWEHWSNGTHYWAEYQGGYAIYNLSGGVPAVTHSDVLTGGLFRNTPGRYVPVGQGFYVVGDSDGGAVVFKNSQRVFQRETGSCTSIFIKGTSKEKEEINNISVSIPTDDVMRIRVGFESPDGYHRQTLVSFLEGATDEIDHIYDAKSGDFLPNDAFFLQEDQYFVIQAFGEFNEDREIPIVIFIEENQSGGVQKFMIDGLENIPDDVEIYIKDNYSDGETYDIRNTSGFDVSLASGEHKDRFALVFLSRLKRLDELATIDDGVTVFMNNTAGEIVIQKNAELDFKQVTLFNYLGQVIRIWDKNVNERNFTLPVEVSTGVYIVSLETEQGTISKKILTH